MLSLEGWTAVGVVGGALLVILALLREAIKGFKRMLKAWRKFGTLMDQLLGNEKNPSLMQVLEETRADGAATRDRVMRVEAAQDELKQGLARLESAHTQAQQWQVDHLQAHGLPGPGPAARRDRRR